MIYFRDLGKWGRVGNQLFECATTIALALRNNTDYRFPPGGYQHFLNIPADKFTTRFPKLTEYHESHFHYAPIPYLGDMNLNGYFQSEKYFEDYKDIIKDCLTPKGPNGILQDVTSIHVRRGDYLTLSNCYNILDMNYYQTAMNITNTSKYFVFSDDIEYCKKIFSGTQFIFMEQNDPYVDLLLQSRCEHNIIANSSFSWWSAWLNRNPDKKVIAPRNWFGPQLGQHNTKDLLPQNWTTI